MGGESSQAKGRATEQLPEPGESSGILGNGSPKRAGVLARWGGNLGCGEWDGDYPVLTLLQCIG